MNLIALLAAKYPDKFILGGTRHVFTLDVDHCQQSCAYFDIKSMPMPVFYPFNEYNKNTCQLDVNSITFDFKDESITITSFLQLEELALKFYADTLEMYKEKLKEKRIKMIKAI